MPKKYRLLKDLPNAKAGEIYNQTENGQDYVNYKAMNTWDVCYPAEYVERSLTWFEEIKEKEVIEIRLFEIGSPACTFIQYAGGYEKYKKIIDFANEILNNEQPKEEKSFSKQVDDYVNEALKQDAINQLLSGKTLSGEFVTKEECERREKKAFESALTGLELKMNFPTYEDYQQSLKK